MAGGAYISISESNNQIKSTWRSWLVVLSAGLFFFYEFIQMNMFNAISADVMRDFHINATQLGEISSYYFTANVIFLFVAGIVLDRFSPKKLMLAALAICVAGILLFLSTSSYPIACISRFMAGIGSAFCFLSSLRLASRWFAPRQLALVIGCIVTMAMTGGAVAQVPLRLLVEALGWREALIVDSVLGGIVFLSILLIVRDYPNKAIQKNEIECHQELHQIGYWQSLRMAFLTLQNWLAAFYTCTMNLPINVLGGLWGSIYLMDTHQLTAVQASMVSSMLFIGTIVGSPIVGYISDRLRMRVQPMMISAVLAFLIMMLIIYVHVQSYSSLITLFFLMGFVSSAQIISYAYVAENSPRIVTATSISVVNIATMAGIGISQALFGYFMDQHAAIIHEKMGIYQASDFHVAMLIFPVGIIIAWLITMMLRNKKTGSHLV